LKGKIMSEARQKKKLEKEKRRVIRGSPRYKLDVFWRKCRHNFSAINLVFIAREIDYPKIQKAALREFLTRGNLTFDDFYRALGLPKEVLGLDSSLEDSLWKQCFDICNPNHLAELIESGEKRATDELFKRIDRKSISMGKAKQILIWLFEKTSDKNLAKALWKRIEAIGLSEQELKHLLEADNADKCKLVHHMEKMLARIDQKKTGKAITKIKELIVQIKQGQV
jgi:hypothetical protein